MDLLRNYKQTEFSRISEEILSESAYQKDINNYADLAFAKGFIHCMKHLTDNNEREDIIKLVKEARNNTDNKKDDKVLEYILRLCNDEFKTIDLK
jgi:hypothetical protein